MKKQILFSLFIVFVVFGGFGIPREPFAAQYPSSPIKMMVPAAPGGSLGRAASLSALYLERNLSCLRKGHQHNGC